MLVLRQVEGLGPEVHLRPVGLHLQRVHRALQRDPGRGRRARGCGGDHAGPDAAGDQGHARPVRDRAGAGQEGARRRGLQPLQAHQFGVAEGRRRRARQVEHPADRPDGRRQDAAGADAGAHPRRAVHDRRCDDADRSRLRRRGRREHSRAAAPGRRLQRRRVRARHRLHRRDRQDRAQVGEPEHHARRVRRRRAAGAAQDSRGHGGLGAAAGRPQAPAAGIHPDQHEGHPVHLRRRVRRAREDHRGPHRPPADRLLEVGRRRRAPITRRIRSPTSSRTICSATA